MTTLNYVTSVALSQESEVLVITFWDIKELFIWDHHFSMLFSTKRETTELTMARPGS
jgi:hypothetical protein